MTVKSKYIHGVLKEHANRLEILGWGYSEGESYLPPIAFQNKYFEYDDRIVHIASMHGVPIDDVQILYKMGWQVSKSSDAKLFDELKFTQDSQLEFEKAERGEAIAISKNAIDVNNIFGSPYKGLEVNTSTEEKEYTYDENGYIHGVYKQDAARLMRLGWHYPKYQNPDIAIAVHNSAYTTVFPNDIPKLIKLGWNFKYQDTISKDDIFSENIMFQQYNTTEITDDTITIKNTEIEDDTKRTSRGMIQELNELIYNLMAAADHLLDLPPDELIKNLEEIEILNNTRQNILASYAKAEDVDHRYHCTFKHLLKSLGICKEAIIAAKRGGYNEILSTLLTEYYICNSVFNQIVHKYLKVENTGIEAKDCQRCLDDIVLDR